MSARTNLLASCSLTHVILSHPSVSSTHGKKGRVFERRGRNGFLNNSSSSSSGMTAESFCKGTSVTGSSFSSTGFSEGCSSKASLRKTDDPSAVFRRCALVSTLDYLLFCWKCFKWFYVVRALGWKRLSGEAITIGTFDTRPVNNFVIIFL